MNLLKQFLSKFPLAIFTLLLTACSPQYENNTLVNAETARTAQCLALQSQCQFDLMSGQVEVLFDVEKIIAEQSFNMVVNYHGTETLTDISGYLEGVDMFMGKIPLFIEEHVSGSLKDHSKNSSAANTLLADVDAKLQSKENALVIDEIRQTFQGEVLVGSCSAEQMTWRIWLTFTTNENKTYNKTFTVESYRM